MLPMSCLPLPLPVEEDSMKKHKKFLSLLMTLLMAILSIPAVVLAEDISKPPSEVSETTEGVFYGQAVRYSGNTIPVVENW